MKWEHLTLSAPLKRVITQKKVEHTIARTYHIPKSQINASERAQVKTLESKLKRRIFAQEQAIEKLARAIKIAKASPSQNLIAPLAAFLAVLVGWAKQS